MPNHLILVLVSALLSLAAVHCFAADPATRPTLNPVRLRILPWNNHKAAVSLTYDDGDPGHLDIAIPEMDKRSLKGTFNLIASSVNDRIPQWQRAFDNGHELANHSDHHLHPAQLTAAQIASEVDDARTSLEKRFGHRVVTFAYPFGETTPALRDHLAAGYIVSRAGGDQFQPLDADPDWQLIPSMVTLTRHPLSTYQQWLIRATDQGAWCVFMIHGIEGKGWGWEPVPRDIYTGLLDELVNRKADIWTATFADVACYFRAQKRLERATVRTDGRGTTWSWQLPPALPPGISLKIVLMDVPDGITPTVLQGNRPRLPDPAGIYSISADDLQLTVRLP